MSRFGFNLNLKVRNIDFYSPPGGYLNQTAGGSDSSVTATGVTTGLAAVPTNAMDNSNRNCSQWYTVSEPPGLESKLGLYSFVLGSKRR